MKRAGSFAVTALILLSTSGTSTQVAQSYAGAAQVYQQMAGRLSGADRQCALAFAQYYGCLSRDLAGRCRDPGCTIVGGGSSTPRSSSGGAGASVPVAGGTRAQQALNSAFDQINEMARQYFAARSALLDQRLAGSKEISQYLADRSLHREDAFKAEEEALDLATKAYDLTEDTEGLRLLAEAERRARTEPEPEELREQKEIDELLERLATYHPGQRPAASLPPDEVALSGDGIPDAIDFSQPLAPAASKAPIVSSAAPATSVRPAVPDAPAQPSSSPDSSTSGAPVPAPPAADSPVAVPVDASVPASSSAVDPPTAAAPSAGVEQTGASAPYDPSLLDRGRAIVRSGIEREINGAPDRLLGEAGIGSRGLPRQAFTNLVGSLNEMPDGSNVLPSVVVSRASGYLYDSVKEHLTNSLVDWDRVNTTPLGREMLDLTKAHYDFPSGIQKYPTKILDRMYKLLDAGTADVVGGRP